MTRAFLASLFSLGLATAGVSAVVAPMGARACAVAVEACLTDVADLLASPDGDTRVCTDMPVCTTLTDQVLLAADVD